MPFRKFTCIARFDILGSGEAPLAVVRTENKWGGWHLVSASYSLFSSCNHPVESHPALTLSFILKSDVSLDVQVLCQLSVSLRNICSLLEVNYDSSSLFESSKPKYMIRN